MFSLEPVYPWGVSHEEAFLMEQVHEHTAVADNHASHEGHDAGHGGHAGHGADHVGQFRRLFWINLIIAVPVIAFSGMFAMLI